MYLYNIVFDGNEPVFCSGAQSVNDMAIRVFSRYFAFDKYKTDGTDNEHNLIMVVPNKNSELSASEAFNHFGETGELKRDDFYIGPVMAIVYL